MHTTNLRKIGGSVVLTLPPAILETLGLREGSTVGVAVDSGRLVIYPNPRPRYAMAELLAASDYSKQLTSEEREWIDAPTVGRELI
jgi:antitoxin ChpS